MIAPRTYRKRPVQVDAMRLMQDNAQIVLDWIERTGGQCAYSGPIGLDIFTPEGTMLARWGDYVIRGVRGEHYPCAPDVFAETYEAVTCEIGEIVDGTGCQNEPTQRVTLADGTPILDICDAHADALRR